MHSRLVEVLPQVVRLVRLGLPLEAAGQGRLTPEQFAVLKELREHGPRTIGDLAAARGVAVNSASALADRLQGAGLVLRTEDPRDRRAVRVSLTPQGAALLDQLLELRRRAMRSLLDQLTDEQLAALEAGLAALDQLATTAGARVPAGVGS